MTDAPGPGPAPGAQPSPGPAPGPAPGAQASPGPAPGAQASPGPAPGSSSWGALGSAPPDASNQTDPQGNQSNQDMTSPNANRNAGYLPSESHDLGDMYEDISNPRQTRVGSDARNMSKDAVRTDIDERPPRSEDWNNPEWTY